MKLAFRFQQCQMILLARLRRRTIMQKSRIYQPSRAQISAACRDIQQRWSDKERASRTRGADAAWYPPGVWERLRVGVGRGIPSDDD
jgi:hypothetical protein